MSTGALGQDADSEMLLRAVARAADALFVVDRNGFIRFLNPAAASILGYDGEAELTGRPGHETIHYKYPDGSAYPVDDCGMLRVRVTGQTVRSEDDWFVRKDGSLVPVAYGSAPYPDGDGWGAVITFRDISERLRQEEAIRRQELARAHLADVRAARRRIAAASDAARKEIERNLHDGAQQQLIAVSMRLEEARAAAQDDPWLAAAAVDKAQRELRIALRDLRELARGIHPVVLTTRGLPDAVRAMARRSTIPTVVEVQMDGRRRLPEAIERSAYFVVAEALANAQKHSGASRLTVRLEVSADALTFSVADNGTGGATVGDGGGLSGARQRLDAVGGTLDVISPQTGPTVLVGHVPLSPMPTAAV